MQRGAQAKAARGRRTLPHGRELAKPVRLTLLGCRTVVPPPIPRRDAGPLGVSFRPTGPPTDGRPPSTLPCASHNPARSGLPLVGGRVGRRPIPKGREAPFP